MAKSAISTPMPVLPAGHRLVPAKVGRRNATSTLIWIVCPVWFCTVDHVAEPEANLEDIAHQGNDFGTSVPSVIDDYSEVTLYARTYSDPFSADPRMRAPHLLVGNGRGQDAQMTPGQARVWLEELDAFRAQVHRAISACEAHAGDSDTDMDEALRRVRGGAV